RVVAELLELGEGGQDLPAPLDALRLLDLLERAADYRLVQGRLLAGERAVNLHLVLGGKVLDYRAVGLDPAQEQRADERFQSRGCVGVSAALDGRGEAPAERRRRAQVTRVEKLEDAPQVGQAVLDGRAGERRAPLRGQLARGLGGAGRRVLDVLGLVQDHLVPLDRGQRRLVAVEQGVGAQDHVVAGGQRGELRDVALGAVVHEPPQRRREARQLALPVTHDGRRAHQQGGATRGIRAVRRRRNGAFSLSPATASLRRRDGEGRGR